MEKKHPRCQKYLRGQVWIVFEDAHDTNQKINLNSTVIAKTRPYLVVQDSELINETIRPIIACPLTSKPTSSFSIPGDPIVELDGKVDTILTSQIRAIDSRKFNRYLGTVPQDAMMKVNAQLARTIGLFNDAVALYERIIELNTLLFPTENPEARSLIEERLRGLIKNIVNNPVAKPIFEKNYTMPVKIPGTSGHIDAASESDDDVVEEEAAKQEEAPVTEEKEETSEPVTDTTSMIAEGLRGHAEGKQMSPMQQAFADAAQAATPVEEPKPTKVEEKPAEYPKTVDATSMATPSMGGVSLKARVVLGRDPILPSKQGKLNRWSVESAKDMLKLRDKGLTHGELGVIYGLTPDQVSTGLSYCKTVVAKSTHSADTKGALA